MALSPLQADDTAIMDSYNETDGAVVTPEVETSRTYTLDIDSGQLGDIIDGTAAVRQFILKAIFTARFRFQIYDDDYGCELEDLVGQDVSQSFLEMEIPRVVTEALIYDERIDDVRDFYIEHIGDGLYITFTVVLHDGSELTEEVSV